MIRILLISLLVIGCLGGGYYFFAKDKASDSVSVADADTVPTASGLPEGGEYWTKRCEKDGTKHCEVFQRLTVKETNQRLIEFAVGYAEDKEKFAQAAIVLPLGVLLSEGIIITVDGGTPLTSLYRTCGPDGCLALIKLPDAFFNMMKSGKGMVVTFTDSGTGQKINVEMVLTGFGKAIESL